MNPPLSYLNKLAAEISYFYRSYSTLCGHCRGSCDRFGFDRLGGRKGYRDTAPRPEVRTRMNDGSAVDQDRLNSRTRHNNAWNRTRPSRCRSVRETHFRRTKIANNAERFHHRRSRQATARSMARMREWLAVRVSFAPSGLNIRTYLGLYVGLRRK